MYVVSAINTDLNVIKVTFSENPLAANSSGVNDATNKANYVITGMTVITVLSAEPAPSDPLSILLTVSPNLPVGAWTVTCSTNIQTVQGLTLQVPNSKSFTVSLYQTLGSFNFNDTAESFIRKHLSPAFQGKGWEAFISGMAVGEQYNWDQANYAKNQVHASSANDIFLEQRGADYGISKPFNLGISDELFRKYILQTKNSKVTAEAAIGILEIFFGSESVRAQVTSQNSENFVLANQQELDILIDEKKAVKVVFTATDFSSITSAKAIEIAAVINRQFFQAKIKAFADQWMDPETGLIHLRIYSSTLGTNSSIRITGGNSQGVFLFPSQLSLCGSPLPTWNITINSTTGTTRFTATSTGSTGLDLRGLQAGDYVNIYGAEFNLANRGSFPITDTGWYYTLNSSTLNQYFEFKNAGFIQSGIVQLNTDSILYFRPTKNTIFTEANRSVTLDQKDGVLSVKYPATSVVVEREETKAAYWQPPTVKIITSLEKVGQIVTVTSSNHGLQPTQQVILDEAYASNSPPGIVSGTTGTNSGTTDRSIASLASLLATSIENSFQFGFSVKLPSNKALIGGGYNLNSGVLTARSGVERFDITAVNTISNTIQDTYTYTDRANLGTARAFPGASLGELGNPTLYNKVFVTGGHNGSTTTYATSEYFNDSGNTWTSGPSMANARAAHGQSAIKTDSRILVTGGQNLHNRAFSSCEILDNNIAVTPSPWSSAGNLTYARAQHEQVSLPDGRVLVVGGRSLSNGHLLESDTVALWRMESSVGTVPDVTGSYPLTDTLGNTVTGESYLARNFVVGGSALDRAHDNALTTLFLGDFTIEGWFNNVSGAYWGPIFNYSNTTNSGLADNALIQFGITNAADKRFYVAWQYGSSVNVISQSALKVTDLIGSYGWVHWAVTKKTDVSTSEVKLYINGILTDTWTMTNNAGGTASKVQFANDATGRFSFGTHFSGYIDDTRISNTVHTDRQVWRAYQLSTGELIQSDSYRLGPILNFCEVYNPLSNTWSLTGNMANGRVFHKTVLLPDGRVLVVGGVGYNSTNNSWIPGVGPLPIKEAEVWDPKTGLWSNAGNTAFEHSSTWAHFISSKNYVVIGGGESAAIEYYNVGTGKWGAMPNSLTTSRVFAASSLMDNGHVFVVGGLSSPGNTSNANYLFIPNYNTFNTKFSNIVTVDTVLDSNTWTFKSDDRLSYSTASTVTATYFKAISRLFKGPYILDTKSTLTTTSTETGLLTNIYKNQKYTVIKVADASNFPADPGWICIGFGYEYQAGPVKYLGKISKFEIKIDSSFIFPENIPTVYTGAISSGGTTGSTTLTVPAISKAILAGTVLVLTGGTGADQESVTVSTYVPVGGTTINLSTAIVGNNRNKFQVVAVNVVFLYQKGSWNPDSSELGAFYATDSASGRVAAEQSIVDNLAAGFEIKNVISYPGDRGLGNEGHSVDEEKKTDLVYIYSE